MGEHVRQARELSKAATTHSVSSPRRRGPIRRFIDVLDASILVYRAHNHSQGLWVPACAGTTWMVKCAALRPRHKGHPPRTGGIVTWSRRQARRSISSQARNCRSLLMQIRTSLKRALSQITETAELLKPGLALMKASSISAGAIVLTSDNSRKSSGIFTAERALRTVSK